MDWLNLHSSVLDSPEFVGSAPRERSTWLCLQRFCIGQENGGRIAGARGWKDRQWQQLARVTLREVTAASQLWSWEGEDLVVVFYPIQKEQEVRRNREHGSRGGRPPGSEKENPNGTTRLPTRFVSAETERKGKEGKGKGTIPSAPPAGESGERASSELFTQSPADPATPPPPTEPPATPKPRERNPLFDALALATDGNPDQLTGATARAVGVALAQIRKVSPDLTPSEIDRRAANYRAHFRDAALTAGALAKHWGRCEHGIKGAAGSTPPGQRPSYIPADQKEWI